MGTTDFFRGRWVYRGVLLLFATMLVLTAGFHLRIGEPDYRNHFHQPVSSHVALLLGLGLLLVSLVPWPSLGSDSASRTADRRSPSSPRREIATRLPGRNSPCRCKSGKKYERCCFREDWVLYDNEGEDIARTLQRHLGPPHEVSCFFEVEGREDRPDP